MILALCKSLALFSTEMISLFITGKTLHRHKHFRAEVVNPPVYNLVPVHGLSRTGLQRQTSCPPTYTPLPTAALHTCTPASTCMSTPPLLHICTQAPM